MSEFSLAILLCLPLGACWQRRPEGSGRSSSGWRTPSSTWTRGSAPTKRRRRRLLDGAGFPDPDGHGPLPRFRLSLKTSTSEVYRVQAAVTHLDLSQVGIALDVRSTELATLLGDVVKGSFEMYTLQFVGVTDPDMLRRVAHSGPQPPAGLNRVHHVNGEFDRLIDEAARALDDRARRALCTKAQQLMADLPYISHWYKTNVAVFQPDIHGVRLSPSADVTFLKDVYRQAAGSPVRP